MSRKSAKRPAPWLLSCANAATKRSRSPGVSVLAFFRILTISLTPPTNVVPLRASILTSPLFTLARLPAAKNETDAPVIGTGSVRLLEKAPVVPRRNTTAPPPAADTLVICTFVVGEVAPDGSVTRIRHGDGAH